MAKDPADRYARRGGSRLAAHHALSTPYQNRPSASCNAASNPARPAPAHHRPALASRATAEPWQPAPPRPRRRTRTPWLALATTALVLIAALAGLGIWLGTRTTHHQSPGGHQTPPPRQRTSPTVPPSAGLNPAQHRTNQHHHGRPHHPTAGTFSAEPAKRASHGFRSRTALGNSLPHNVCVCR